jgi:hypothetical protein
MPKNDIWMDFVCVWERTDIPETEIVKDNQNIGILEQSINLKKLETIKKC